MDLANLSKTESADTTTSSTDASALTAHTIQNNGPPEQSPTKEDNVRSLAMAITTEKLNLKTADSPQDGNDNATASTPLIERAVESATCTIVTSAIETLLRDEGHTRETYLKHEKELSRSSIPGVVPISKQLFASKSDDGQEQLQAAAAANLLVIGNGVAATCNGEHKASSSESLVVHQQPMQKQKAAAAKEAEGTAPIAAEPQMLSDDGKSEKQLSTALAESDKKEGVGAARMTRPKRASSRKLLD